MEPFNSIIDLLIPTAYAADNFRTGLLEVIGTGRGSGLSGLTFPTLFANIGTFLTGLVAALALVALVWGGVMYILSLGDESRSARAKHIILYAILGLLVAGLTNLILFTICGIGGFQASVICSGIYSSFTFFDVILRIANVLLAPAGAIAFVALIYGGYLYMTSGGDESRASRAKHAIFYALLGLAVIGIAGIVVNVVIGLLP